MSLFEGYDPATSVNSLFSGDTQKDNGMFTTPPTQLGGAAPYSELIKPERSNDGGPTHIMLTSKYTPAGDLTSASVITLTVTVTNVGDTDAKGIVFKATLQDDYAALVADPEPDPPFKDDSSIDEELVWDKLANNKPFDLDAGESTDISWSFKANKDDVILRWKLVAEYGAGESILLQWIPIKNPNPQAGSSGGTAGSGTFTNPCATAGGSGPFPDSSTGAQLVSLFKQHWNIDLVSTSYDYTSGEYHGVLKAWWEVLTTVECTPYLQQAFAGHALTINSDALGGWWGTYQGNWVQQMDIQAISQGTVPHIKQNLIHELGHVYEGSDPNGITAKWEPICHSGSPYAEISGYGTNNCNENFAEVMGYYVVRESNEWGADPPARCPDKNPFDWGQAGFYDFAKTNVFNGKEYGPQPPNPPTSC
jgi:hypothetical protein